jgi:hypothetical protein
MKATTIALLSTGAICALTFATPAAAQYIAAPAPVVAAPAPLAGPVDAAGALIAAPFVAAGDIVGGLTGAPAYAPTHAPGYVATAPVVPAAPVVPVVPFAATPHAQCSVLHDWNGRLTAACGP